MDQNMSMTSSRIKAAGAQQALAELGLEKNAIIGSLIGKGLGAVAGGVGRVVGGLGKGLWGATKGVTGAAGDAVQGFGGRVLSSAGKAGMPEGATKVLGGLGKNMGRDMATFGALGGGIEAALADPGQRWEAFQRGALGGAIGGVGWAAGSNAARMGLSKGLGALGSKGVGALKSSNPFKALQGVAKPGALSALGGKGHTLAQRGKILGASALTAGVPFAAGFGGSMLMPMPAPAQPQRPFYQQQQPYYPAAAAFSRQGRY